MKVVRFITVLFSLSIIMLMQACGSGGGTTDTSGSLTLSAPTVTDNGNGTSLVSATATYTPPAGKTAQGVVITISATDNFGNTQSVNDSLTSGSNAVIQPFIIRQHLGTSTQVSIVASIGGMTSGVLAIVPKFTPATLAVASSTADFLVTDNALTHKFITFSGGIPPYAVTSSVPGDIESIISSLNLLTGGGTIQITLINAAPVGAVATTATVTLTDANGGSVPITVNYFK